MNELKSSRVPKKFILRLRNNSRYLYKLKILKEFQQVAPVQQYKTLYCSHSDLAYPISNIECLLERSNEDVNRAPEAATHAY